MENISVENGTVVLSSIRIHAAVTAEGVVKKNVQSSLATKLDGTSLIKRNNVSVSSMKRNHWITGH